MPTAFHGHSVTMQFNFLNNFHSRFFFHFFNFICKFNVNWKLVFSIKSVNPWQHDNFNFYYTFVQHGKNS